MIELTLQDLEIYQADFPYPEYMGQIRHFHKPNPVIHADFIGKPDPDPIMETGEFVAVKLPFYPYVGWKFTGSVILLADPEKKRLNKVRG